MRLSGPHNMLSKVAVKRKFLPCRNPTLVPTIITQDCPFNSMVSPQHCSLILGTASTYSLYMSTRRSNNKGSELLPASTRIYPYGGSQPLETLGKCHVTVDAFDKRSLVEFVMVNHKGETILGRDSSVTMGVLHVGPPNHPTCSLYKLASEQENTANAVHTDLPTPNVISLPHPDHPATIDQNPIPELHSLPTSLHLNTIFFEVSPSLREPGPRQRSGSRDTHEKRHHPRSTPTVTRTLTCSLSEPSKEIRSWLKMETGSASCITPRL